jgi:pimeloyl-ACP methyl ester carboxylesterase
MAVTTLPNVVTAQDGTIIGYHQLGSGPGLVLVHGAMESSESHMQLAEALAHQFTVYLPDRRGRGTSGPYNGPHSIQKDVEDLNAILTHTGVHRIFGVSSGGDICLQAALTLPSVQKTAVYEPALFLEPSEPAAILAHYDQDMARGDLAAALVTGMKGAQMGPPIFNLMPRWLLKSLTKLAMRSDPSMRTLAPTLHYDFQIVTELSGKLERFKTIQTPVLLLGGSASPAYLKTALDALEKILPNAQRIELPGLHHGGSGNTNRGGHPDTVAQELIRFFA